MKIVLPGGRTTMIDAMQSGKLVPAATNVSPNTCARLISRVITASLAQHNGYRYYYC